MPEPLWRRALVLVAAGLAAAFVSFLVGLWLFAPSR
jgi:VIT1/CCC1 family predicted Fe2+/Mn2+ transporter